MSKHTFIDPKVAYKNGDFENIYAYIKNMELETREVLIEFQNNYPEAIKESNIDNIISALKTKKNNQINDT